MAHDFKAFPELTNTQMQFYYLDSPHKQITEDIKVRVVKVHDGDTITANWSERDFNFPVRFSNLASPELNEEDGHEARDWLENRILGEEVDLILSKQRVEKWGRLLARVVHNGMDLADEQIMRGLGVPWENRAEGKIIPPVKHIDMVIKWD